MKRSTRVLVASMSMALALGSAGQAKADLVTVLQAGTISQANKFSFNNLHHFDNSLGTLTKVDISINWTASEPGSNVPIVGPSKHSNNYDQSILQTVKANGSPIGSFYLTGNGMNNGPKISFSGHGDISFNSQEILENFSNKAVSLSILSSLPQKSSKAADGTYFRTDQLDTYEITLKYTYNPFSTTPDDDPFVAAPEPSSLTLLGMATFTLVGYCGWKKRKQSLPA